MIVIFTLHTFLLLLLIVQFIVRTESNEWIALISNRWGCCEPICKYPRNLFYGTEYLPFIYLVDIAQTSKFPKFFNWIPVRTRYRTCELGWLVASKCIVHSISLDLGACVCAFTCARFRYQKYSFTHIFNLRQQQLQWHALPCIANVSMGKWNLLARTHRQNPQRHISMLFGCMQSVYRWLFIDIRT